MYCIKIKSPNRGTNRYIAYCDDNWYETSASPIYQYKTREECIDVIMKLGKHYIYNTEIINDLGKKERYDYFALKYPMVSVPTTETTSFNDWNETSFLF